MKPKTFVLVCCAVALAVIILLRLHVQYPLDGGKDAVGTESLSLERVYFDRHEIQSVYFERSEWIEKHSLPYRDVLEEYPQLGVLYISLPRLLTNSPEIFTGISVALNCVLFGLLIWLTLTFLKQRQQSPWRAAALLLPSFLYFTIARYDIVPTLLTLLVFVLVRKKKFAFGFAILACATLAKWYPALLLPYLLAYAESRGMQNSERKKTCWWFVGVLAVAFGFSFAVVGWQIFYPYATHLDRGIEIGGVLTVAAKAVLTWFSNTTQAAALSGLLKASLFLQLLPLILGAFFYRKVKQWISSTDDVLISAVLVLNVFILASRFYSSQWHLWWASLALFVLRGKKEWILFFAIDLLNYIQAPLLYTYIGPNTFLFDLVVIIRSLLMILLSWFLFKRLQARYASRWKASNTLRKNAPVA